MKKAIMRGLLSIGLLLLCGVAGAAEVVTYYYTDAQGTPLATTDAQGNITNAADYRPYAMQALGQPGNSPGYTGHVNDSDTDLIYMQSRYYDPEIGRFLSRDPIRSGVDGINRYAYASNNPFYYEDPTGMEDCSEACMKMRRLSDYFSGIGRNFMSMFHSDSGRGALGPTGVVNSFVQGTGSDEAAGALDDDAAAAGAVVDMTPGAGLASCMFGGCEVSDWALATISAVPGDGEIAGAANAFEGAVSKGARTEARNLAEKLALDEAKGGAGTQIMKGGIVDKRFPAAEWAKMQHMHPSPGGQNIVIHYWQRIEDGLRIGFKFKDPPK